MEIKKCEYLENEKTFLDEIKKGYHLLKKRKISDTSFNRSKIWRSSPNPLSANPTNWSNTLKQFADELFV